MTTVSTGDSDDAGSDTDETFDAFFSFNDKDDIVDFEDDEYVSYIFDNHLQELQEYFSASKDEELTVKGLKYRAFTPLYTLQTATETPENRVFTQFQLGEILHVKSIVDAKSAFQLTFPEGTMFVNILKEVLQLESQKELQLFLRIYAAIIGTGVVNSDWLERHRFVSAEEYTFFKEKFILMNDFNGESLNNFAGAIGSYFSGLLIPKSSEVVKWTDTDGNEHCVPIALAVSLDDL